MNICKSSNIIIGSESKGYPTNHQQNFYSSVQGSAVDISSARPPALSVTVQPPSFSSIRPVTVQPPSFTHASAPSFNNASASVSGGANRKMNGNNDMLISNMIPDYISPAIAEYGGDEERSEQSNIDLRKTNSPPNEPVHADDDRQVDPQLLRLLQSSGTLDRVCNVQLIVDRIMALAQTYCKTMDRNDLVLVLLDWMNRMGGSPHDAEESTRFHAWCEGLRKSGCTFVLEGHLDQLLSTLVSCLYNTTTLQVGIKTIKAIALGFIYSHVLGGDMEENFKEKETEIWEDLVNFGVAEWNCVSLAQSDLDFFQGILLEIERFYFLKIHLNVYIDYKVEKFLILY